MAYTDELEQFNGFSKAEISEMAFWQGRSEDAMNNGDSGYARMAYDEMGKIYDNVHKREQQKQTKEDVKAIMKLPSSKRHEYYEKVKNERGSEAAKSLVSEVKKHIRLNMEMER